MSQVGKHFLRQLTLLVLVNLIALAGWLALFLKISRTSGLISETREAMAAEEAKREGSRLLSGQLDQTKLMREKLDSFFLPGGKEPIAEFLEGVESLGRQAGLSLAIVSVVEDEKNLRLTFKTAGSFGATSHLIKLIEALPMKISLKDSRLETQPVLDGPVIWEGLFVLDLKSFLPNESR